jgi:hypothetical protein
MPKGYGTKFICVIKCNFYNFDEVWSKRRNERHGAYNLFIQLNFLKKVLDFQLANFKRNLI